MYILCGTETALLPAEILASRLPIKGLIGLANTPENAAGNEYYDYSDFCRRCGIEYVPLDSYTIKTPGDKKRLTDLDIDIILSLSWQRLLPDWLINHCRLGVIGSHGSPGGITAGRGRSPQNWALMLGSPELSYSIFWMDAGIDSGRIIDTRVIHYTESDNILTSYIKTGLALADMMVKNHNNGNFEKRHGTPQNEENIGYLPKRTAKDGTIDWTRSAFEIQQFVNALSRPYPGAVTGECIHSIKIWNGRYIQAPETTGLGRPGEIIMVYPGSEFLVSCGDGLYLVTDWEPDEGCFVPEIGLTFVSANFQKQLQNIVNRHLEQYQLPVANIINNALNNKKD